MSVQLALLDSTANMPGGTSAQRTTSPAAASLLENFETLASSPEGVERLRGLAFHLAIQGRLLMESPRPPEQTPATDGLSIPFGLPAGWTWHRVDEVGELKLGRQRSPKNHSGAHMRPYLRVANVHEARIDTSDILEMNFDPEEAERFLLKPDDVLLNEGQSYELVGRPAIYRGEVPGACFQNTLIRFRPAAGVVSEFALVVFRAYMRTGRFRREAQQTTNIAHLSLGRLAAIEFPLPPLAEQKRIVAKVDQLMTLCDELEARQAKKRETGTRLTKSALEALTTAETPEDFNRAWTLVHDEFPSLINATGAIAELRRTVVALALRGRLAAQDPSEGTAQDLLQRLDKQAQWSPEDPDAALPLPPSWQWVPLGKIITAGPKNGYSPKGVEFETPVKSLTLTATTSGRFDGQHFKYIDEEVPKDSELWLRDGDLLIQRGNTIDYVGVAAIYRGPANAFIYPDLIMKLRVSEAMDLEFVHMALNGPVARVFITSRASGTSSSMPKINQATVTAIPVPVPPLGEQRRIMSKVNELMELCDRLEEGIRAAEGLSRKFAEAAIQAVVATQ